jgi:tryptophan synthase beta chain
MGERANAKGTTEDRILLDRDEMPTRYYNILADLPWAFPPPIHPGTKEPLGPEALLPLFSKEVVMQEVSSERFIDIPGPVLEAYHQFGRPTPLQRAKRFEQALGTPARIYFKREDVSPTGSHKLNTAVAQAYYAAKEGVEGLVTETGAGQWGSALSLACSRFDMDCKVFMVRCSFAQKPFRRNVMELYGAEVVPSPSDRTEFGKKLLTQDPDHPGSLGIAISEAVMTVAGGQGKLKYALGSVLNHVLLHQTVIGQEVIKQFEKIDVQPTHMVACIGGGSNLGGFILPMMAKKLKNQVDTKFCAVEPSLVASLCEGSYEYDFGDTAEVTPLIKMHTLGHGFIPPPIHAGGLRYHGAAPIISLLKHHGALDAYAYPQDQTFEAGTLFAKSEGIIPAPESCHAIRHAIELAQEAKRAGKAGKDYVICFNLSGHGLLDLNGYGQFKAGTLVKSSTLVGTSTKINCQLIAEEAK